MKKLIRHFITGEWVEVDWETENGRAVYVYEGKRESVARQSAIRVDKPWTSRTLAVAPAEVNYHNEQLRKAGVLGDAYYDRKDHGRLKCTSKRARNVALRLRNFGDANAGYGDRPPGG